MSSNVHVSSASPHSLLFFSGGFAGRTNKLVDGCYSFWQGGTAALLENHAVDPMSGGYSTPPAQLGDTEGSANLNQGRLFNSDALQRYTLMCAQQFPDGGLRDKPSKPRDFYHSCYNLGGLSVCQHPAGAACPTVWGSSSNLVAAVHPVSCAKASIIRCVNLVSHINHRARPSGLQRSGDRSCGYASSFFFLCKLPRRSHAYFFRAFLTVGLEEKNARSSHLSMPRRRRQQKKRLLV